MEDLGRFLHLSSCMVLMASCLLQIPYFIRGFTISVVKNEVVEGEAVKLYVTFEEAFADEDIYINTVTPVKDTSLCRLIPAARRHYHDRLPIERENIDEIYYINFEIYLEGDNTSYQVQAKTKSGPKAAVDILVFKSQLDSCVFQTKLFMTSGGQLLDIKHSMAEKRDTPVIRLNSSLFVDAYIECGSFYSHKYIIERFSDDYVDFACNMPDLIGEVDLYTYSSYWQALPVDVQMEVRQLLFGSRHLPAGLLRFTVRLTSLADPSLFVDFSGLLTVAPDKSLTNLQLVPAAAGMAWPEDKEFVITVADSILLLTVPGSGYIHSNKTEKRYIWTCKHGENLCDFIMKDEPNDKKLIPAEPNKPNQLQRSMDISAFMEFKGVAGLSGGNFQNFSGPKSFLNLRFSENTLRIFIRIVRNSAGGLYYYGTSPMILKIECLECKYLKCAGVNISYSWKIKKTSSGRNFPHPGSGDVLGSNRQYLVILPFGRGTPNLKVWALVTTQKPFSKITATAIDILYKGRGTPSYYPDTFSAYSPPRVKRATDVFSIFSFILPTCSGDPNDYLPVVYEVAVRSGSGEITLARTYSKLIESIAIFTKKSPVFVDVAVYTSFKEHLFDIEWPITTQDKGLTLPASILEKVLYVLKSTSYGLASHYTLAQEMADGDYEHEDKLQAINYIQSDMLNQKITHLKSELAANIMYLMYGSLKGQLEADNLTTDACLMFGKIQAGRQQVDVDDDEKTFLLSQAQISTITRINLLMENSTETEGDVPITLGLCLLSWIRNLTIFYTRLYTCRGEQHITGLLYDTVIWWDELPSRDLTLSPRNTFLYDVTIPRIELEKSILKVTGKEGRDDFYLNIVLFTSVTNFLTKVDKIAQRIYGEFDLNLGIVELYVETKGEGQKLVMQDMEKPVELTFQDEAIEDEDEDKSLNFVVDVFEDEDGNVTDSTCIIFAMKVSTDYGTIVTVSGPEEYNLNYSTITSPHPSGYLQIEEVPTMAAGDSFHTFFTPVSKYFAFTHKGATNFLHIRVASKKFARPNLNQNLNLTTLIEKRINLTATAKHVDCAHFESGLWHRDMCKTKVDIENNALICSCSVHAPYSAMIKSASGILTGRQEPKLVLQGPSYITSFLVLAMWIAFVAYFIVAKKLDRQERFSGRTLVVPDSFSSNCEEKFLVCLMTGVIPGSATRSSIGFTLVGETGATSRIQANDNLTFLPGSELWFALGSNNILDYLEGVSLDIDIKDAEDNWFFKSMVVFSINSQIVYEYKAKQWLNEEKCDIYLPTYPVYNTFSTNVMGRFWRLMRQRHTVLSLFLPVPGLVCNRVERLLVALFMLSTTMVGALIARQPPGYVLAGDEEESFRLDVIASKTFGVCMVALCSSLVMGQIMSCVHGRRQRCLWPAAPRTQLPLLPEKSSYVIHSYGSDHESGIQSDQEKKSQSSLDTAETASFAASDSVDGPLPRTSLPRHSIAEAFEARHSIFFAKRPSAFVERRSTKTRQSSISFNKRSSRIASIHERKIRLLSIQSQMSTTSETDFNESAAHLFHLNQHQHQLSPHRRPTHIIFQPQTNVQSQSNKNNNSDSVSVEPRISNIPTRKISFVIDTADETRKVQPDEEFRASRGSSVDHEGIVRGLTTRKHIQQATDKVITDSSHRTRYLMPKLIDYFLYIAVISMSIISSYFTSVYGYFYSQSQGFEWAALVCLPVILDVFILEPLIFLVISFLARLVGVAPVIISEVEKRAAVLDKECDKRIVLEYLDITPRTLVPPIQSQPHQESASLLLLQEKLHRVFRTRSKKLSMLELKDGFVYLVLIVTATTVIMNLQSRIFASYTQARYVERLFQLGPKYVSPQKAQTVEDLWYFLHHSFVPNVERLKPQRLRKEPSSLFMISTSRLRQVRVIPDEAFCHKRNPKLIEPKCNFALEKMDVNTFHYHQSWKGIWIWPRFEQNDPYLYRNGSWSDIFISRHMIYPSGGYEAILTTNKKKTKSMLDQLQRSDWIDENTRAVFLDFTLFNTDTSVASIVVIGFLFTRGGIFQVSNIYSPALSFDSAEFYVVACCVVAFFFLNCYSIFRELTLLYNNGLFNHLARGQTYFELAKISLSFGVIAGIILRYIWVRMLLAKYVEVSLKKDVNTNIGFANFLPLAHLILFLNVSCGLLAFIVLFQVLGLLNRLIERLAILFSLIVSTLVLAVQPLIIFTAFAMSGHLLFASLDFDFSSFEISYTTVFQNAVKPTHNIYRIREFSPIVGSLFILCLLGGISFVFIDLFKIFLNEAYSQIVSRSKIETYGKEKTDFLQLFRKLFG